MHFPVILVIRSNYCNGALLFYSTSESRYFHTIFTRGHVNWNKSIQFKWVTSTNPSVLCLLVSLKKKQLHWLLFKQSTECSKYLGLFYFGLCFSGVRPYGFECEAGRDVHSLDLVGSTILSQPSRQEFSVAFLGRRTAVNLCVGSYRCIQIALSTFQVAIYLFRDLVRYFLFYTSCGTLKCYSSKSYCINTGRTWLYIQTQ